MWCAYCCGVADCLGAVFVGEVGGVVGAVDLDNCEYELVGCIAWGDEMVVWRGIGVVWV